MSTQSLLLCIIIMSDNSLILVGRTPTAVVLTKKYSSVPGVFPVVASEAGPQSFSRGCDNGQHPSKSVWRTGDGEKKEKKFVQSFCILQFLNSQYQSAYVMKLRWLVTWQRRLTEAKWKHDKRRLRFLNTVCPWLSFQSWFHHLASFQATFFIFYGTVTCYPG